jgi:hypothetical protein
MATPARTLTVSVELPLAPADMTAPDPAVVSDDLRRLWIIEQVRLKRIGVECLAQHTPPTAAQPHPTRWSTPWPIIVASREDRDSLAPRGRQQSIG